MSVIQKIFRVILVLPLFAIVALIVWMNATEGHFKNMAECGCRDIRYTNETKPIIVQEPINGHILGPICTMSICPDSIPMTLYKMFLLSLSNLDFNK